MIKVENLRKVYKVGSEKVVALDNINLEIEKGEYCMSSYILENAKKKVLDAGFEAA